MLRRRGRAELVVDGMSLGELDGNGTTLGEDEVVGSSLGKVDNVQTTLGENEVVGTSLGEDDGSDGEILLGVFIEALGESLP